MKQNEWMIRLVTLRANMKSLYEKQEHVIVPLWKMVFSFAVLMFLRALFPYGGLMNKLWILMIVAAFHAVLPMSFLYISGCAFVALNLWNLSVDLTAGFVLLALAGWLFSLKFNYKYIYMAILTMCMCFLGLGYLLPVAVAITIGYAGIIPIVTGVCFFYYGTCVLETYGEAGTFVGEAGTGIQGVMQYMISNHEIYVLLCSFVVVIVLTTMIKNIFHERAHQLAFILGNVLLILSLLAGRLVFFLNFSMLLVFVLAIVSMLICIVIEFFKGIGDVSRIERISFEDEEYIYYVKAVPKIKVSQKEKNITSIEDDEENNDVIGSDA